MSEGAGLPYTANGLGHFASILSAEYCHPFQPGSADAEPCNGKANSIFGIGDLLQVTAEEVRCHLGLTRLPAKVAAEYIDKFGYDIPIFANDDLQLQHVMLYTDGSATMGGWPSQPQAAGWGISAFAFDSCGHFVFG